MNKLYLLALTITILPIGLFILENQNIFAQGANDVKINVEPILQTEGLNITSTSSYTSGDFLYVVGEVLNNSGEDHDFVKVSATLYNESGNVIGVATAYVNADTLRNGSSSPFKMMIGETDVSDINQVNSIKLSIS